MSDTIQKLKGPLIIIAILFAGFVVYNNFVKVDKGGAILQKGNKTAVVDTPEQDFLPLLLRIQSVSLDERLFLDPVFRTLKDFSRPIIPERPGKPNPFTSQISTSVVSAVESLGFTDATTKPVVPVTTKVPARR
jgi:hypothetical protein